MARDHDYYVYMLTNATRTVLYVGVTSGLEDCTFTYRVGTFHGSFTDQNHANRLVYYEEFSEVSAAIAREKQLKGWRRAKKDALIVKVNPKWEDLSADWERLRRVPYRYAGGQSQGRAGTTLAGSFGSQARSG